MAVTTVHRVPVYGFNDDELRNWPDELRPNPLELESETWPSDVPIVVHLRAAPDFVAHALNHPRPSGASPDAILAIPAGLSADPALRADFDGAVPLGDWVTLSSLLDAPQQFGAAVTAEMIPRSFLAKWNRPLSELSLNDLPDDVRADAAAWWDEPVSHQAFLTALEDRLTYLQPWSGPPRADQAALRQWLRAQPMPEFDSVRTVILATLDAAAVAIARSVADSLNAPVEWLAQALRPPQSAWLVASGAAQVRRVRGRDAVAPRDEAERTEPAAPSPSVDLRNRPRLRGADSTVSEVQLDWDEERGAIVVERVGSIASALSDYGLVVRRGDRVLWKGRSDPTSGRLRLPATELTRALLAESTTAEPIELELLVART